MDLTSGYHQAPISLSTRLFTAFITFAGIFQFTRLPFGPKRAPSYFQEMMASVVLLGLIYFICEVYLDDVIIFGNTPVTVYGYTVTVYGFLILRFTGFRDFFRLPRTS